MGSENAAPHDSPEPRTRTDRREHVQIAGSDPTAGVLRSLGQTEMTQSCCSAAYLDGAGRAINAFGLERDFASEITLGMDGGNERIRRRIVLRSPVTRCEIPHHKRAPGIAVHRKSQRSSKT